MASSFLRKKKMNFQFRHINRLTYPQKHIVICEDDITNQKKIMEHFLNIFDPQGEVQISMVPGALPAAAIINQCKVDLIILDHDMPLGNGTDFLTWMKEYNVDIPVITFSGIPYNNQHMFDLGAQHLFVKGDVIDGKADSLIKSILGLTSLVPELKSGLIETYTNKLYNNHLTPRYWLAPNIMVGGSICDNNDWKHLQNDFGISAALNVETEHSDAGKGIDYLLELQVPDDGTPFPANVVFQAIEGVGKWIREGKKVYIHCQMGGSRSPAFAYAILRKVYGLEPDKALAQIRSVKENYGHHNYHKSYINSIEAVI